MAENASTTTYDEIPYHGSAFHYTHPDRLAAMARFHGLEPSPVATGRVLELGCAEGMNLIPMALSLPEATFVGIDLSSRQVETGQAMIATLGLRNIELQALSILDVGEDFGTFDAIICHGVYSWVPEGVREKILEIMRRHLAPSGVGYVSYNTFPGWHARGMIREMLNYHVQRFSDPRVRLHQARAFLDFLVKCSVYPDTVYTRVLRLEQELLQRSEDSYFFHEHLEEENHPCYFHEFEARLQAHGLQFVGEATFNASEANVSEEARQILHGLSSDLVPREQYIDFLCNRTFRRTVICHREAVLNREPGPAIMRRFRVTTRVQPDPETVGDAELASDQPVDFRSVDRDVHLATNRPLVKLALGYLFRQWPRAFTVEELWAELKPLLERSREHGLVQADDLRPLSQVLLQCVRSDILELSLTPPVFTTEIRERPVASPLARLMAPGELPAINLRHRMINLSDFEELLLPLLDGTRDREALLEALVAHAQEGTISIARDDQPVRDPEVLRAALGSMLEPALRNLARNAFLLG